MSRTRLIEGSRVRPGKKNLGGGARQWGEGGKGEESTRDGGTRGILYVLLLKEIQRVARSNR